MESKPNYESQDRKKITDEALLSLQKELSDKSISEEKRKHIEERIAMLASTKNETLPLSEKENIETVLDHLFIDMMPLQKTMTQLEKLGKTDSKEFFEAKEKYDILRQHYNKAIEERENLIKKTDN